MRTSFLFNIPTSPSKPSLNRRPTLVLALLFAFTTILAHAQNYTSIVVFGDSLSDTGNVAHLTLANFGVRIPGPIADYTDGRLTDGSDTAPAAMNYHGVWIEQLAAAFPAKPPVKNSLDGGTNYAYGFAFTGSGTTLLTLIPPIAVNVNNIGLQITTYLATHPKFSDKTLYVVWGGANDVINATSQNAIVNAAIQQAANVQRLVDAGATQILVLNLPPLGIIPRFNGSPVTSVPANEATELYNGILAIGVDIVRDISFLRHPQIFQLDIFSLLNKIVASPGTFSLVNVTGSSQELPVNPDTYLFWDDLHPTTRGHNLVALAAAKLIAPQKCWIDNWPHGLAVAAFCPAQ